MALHISVFLENVPGKLEAVTKLLADHDINLRGMSLASRGDSGILKIIPDDADKAFNILKESHYVIHKRKVIIAIIEDKPGSLHELLVILSSNGINIEDCYGIVLESEKRAALVLEVEEFPEAEKLLANKGIKLLSDREINLL